RLQLGNGKTAEELRPQTLLHVGNHGLQRFLTDLRPAALLIAHAAGLAAHAESARLASVLAAHGTPEAPEADPARHPQRVHYCCPAATTPHPFHQLRTLHVLITNSFRWFVSGPGAGAWPAGAPGPSRRLAPVRYRS